MENQNEIPNYTKTDIVELPDVMICVVEELSIRKGENIFKDKEGNIKTDKPNEDFLVLRVCNQQFNIDKEYHLKKYNPKSVPENSNLGKFLTKYGKLETGMEVKILKNKDGYYDLYLN